MGTELEACRCMTRIGVVVAQAGTSELLKYERMCIGTNDYTKRPRYIINHP